MRQIVEDIDGMRNQHAVADLDGGSRPDARADTHIAPFADDDPSAMSEDRQLASDMGVCAHDNATAVAKDIPDPRRMAEECPLLELARCPPRHPLNNEMKVQAIDRVRAIALEPGEPARRSALIVSQTAHVQNEPPTPQPRNRYSRATIDSNKDH